MENKTIGSCNGRGCKTTILVKLENKKQPTK